MIAKVIAWGRDRDEALARLRRGAARDDGRGRGRHDQPGLPARAARPPGGAGGHGRHRLARPPAAARRDRAGAPRRRGAAAGRDRARRRRDGRRPRALLRLRAARAPAGRVRFAGASSPAPTAAQAYRLAVSQIAPGRYRILVDGVDRRGRDAAAERHERRLVARRAPTTGRSPPCRAPTCSSRSTACRTGSRATTAAWCAACRPRSSCRSRSPRATRSQAGDVVAVLESMKMETSLTAPFRGRVRQRAVGPQRPGPRARSAAPARRARRRRGPSHRGAPASGSRSRHSPAARSSTPCAASSGSCSATTATPTHGPRRRCGDTTRLSQASTGCCACSPTSARWRGRVTTTRAIASCAQPAGVPARLPALARRRGRGPAARASSSCSSARSRTTASRASTARLPWRRPATGSSSPSSARARVRPSVLAILDRLLERRARGRRRPARRRSTSSSIATDGRDQIVWPTSRARCATAASTSRSSPRRASAPTPRWTAHLGALAAEPDAPGSGRADRARSSSARGRWRRCCCGGWRPPIPRCGARCSRRWPAASTASGCSSASPSSRRPGARSCARPTGTKGRARRLATAFVELDGPRRRDARASPPGPPPSRPATWSWPTSTLRDAEGTDRASGCTRLARRRSRCPPACTGS